MGYSTSGGGSPGGITMRYACLALLLTVLLTGSRPETHASVVGLEGDRMNWEGIPVLPAGSVAPSTISIFAKQGSDPLVSVNHQLLVILVEFNDQSALGSLEADWEASLFGASGSVQDYYGEVSYGQLLITPAPEAFDTPDNGVIGWLPVGYDHPDTGSNTGIANMKLAKDALIAADPYVDYSALDTDSNGALSVSELSILIVAAGYERSYSSRYSPNVWGHASGLTPLVPPPVLDGVSVANLLAGGRYMQIGEWHQSDTTDGHVATIGIMVHEMGHDLGLPDLYDLDLSSEGIGKWGLMGSGSWGTDGGWSGGSPSHLCAWSKEFLGFVTPETVSNETALSVPSVATTDKVYRVNTIDPNQYFLIENRQPVGYDQGLPMDSGGILIWHIDNSIGNVTLNTVNVDETHKRVDVEEAEDGVTGASELDNTVNRGDQQDLFYIGNNFEFDDTTVPSAILYGNIYSGVRVSNISAPGDPMTMDVAYTPPLDGDGDGYYPPADCEDDNAGIHPGAPEKLGDGIDSNCNGDDNCFIATAAFGSKFDGKVDLLRGFRDRHLMGSIPGEAFVEAYYICSPLVAEYIAARAWLKTAVRTLLLPAIGLVWLSV
jgi:M6 family metalloprotease-like protein